MAKSKGTKGRKGTKAVTGRKCIRNGCGEKLPEGARADARFCSVRCRVAHHRSGDTDEDEEYVITAEDRAAIRRVAKLVPIPAILPPIVKYT